MEAKKSVEHHTTLEHALDVATANHKEATRLLEDAKKAHARGDVTDERVAQLESLLAVAHEDLRRVVKEQ